MRGSALRAPRAAIAILPAAFLVVFFLLPALLIVAASFRFPGEFGGLAPLSGAGDTGVTLEAYRFAFGDSIYAEVLLRSIVVAATTTLACLLAAYPVALLIVRSPHRIRERLLLLVLLPFAANFLVRVYAWMILLGPLGLLYSSTAVLIGMVYVHLPFMILPIYVSLDAQDPLLLDAAADLGATPWQRFRSITLPLSVPGVVSGCVLVFVPSLGMFAIPELLGGTGDVLIGNIIREQFIDNRDWPLGSTLSIMLTAAVLALAWAAARIVRRRRVPA